MSSSEMASKQNMSETIICNHVVLINPGERKKQKGYMWRAKGLNWPATQFQLVLGHNAGERHVQPRKVRKNEMKNESLNF